MNDPRHRLTLEDLLRLKRAERPAPEFWTKFERELRAKQLGAIVEKRPWWCSIPRVYVFVLRRRLPLAASAVVAFAIFSYRQFPSFATEQAFPAAGEQIASLPAADAPAAAAAAVAPADAASEDTPAAASPSAVVAVSDIVGRTAGLPRQVARSSISLPMIAMIDGVPEGAATERFDSIARSMGADLGAAQSAAAQAARNLFGAAPHGFEARVMPVSATVAEPLAQMPSPAEERRSRLLADAFPVSTRSEAAGPSNERLLTRLPDDRLYSNSTRYDVETEQDRIGLSIKF
jgi:hypothetical protein